MKGKVQRNPQTINRKEKEGIKSNMENRKEREKREREREREKERERKREREVKTEEIRHKQKARYLKFRSDIKS